jgi:two-component sensor histidine kinase
MEYLASAPPDRSLWPRGDFKPQYVCALVFIVRVTGMVASALTVPTGGTSLLIEHRSVLVVFVILIVFYSAIALAFARGQLDSLLDNRLVVAIDLASVAAINIWASSMAPRRQLDLGGNDVFWMSVIGSIALWGAVHGRARGLTLMGIGAAVLVAMSLANGFPLSHMNWAFLASRLVYVGIGLMATASGLHISEIFEEFRRAKWLRAGEEHALGAMHRRALQDLKVITRLTIETGSPEQRLQDIRQYAQDLAAYVRTWPSEHGSSIDLDGAIRRAVQEADEAGFIDVIISFDAAAVTEPRILDALGEAVGEAARNVVQHARARRASVCVSTNDDVVVAEIFDDGCGFDTLTTPSTNTGLGLSRIFERMAEVQGSASVNSTPGSGSNWLLQVPVLAPNESPLFRSGRLLNR